MTVAETYWKATALLGLAGLLVATAFTASPIWKEWRDEQGGGRRKPRRKRRRR